MHKIDGKTVYEIEAETVLQEDPDMYVAPYETIGEKMQEVCNGVAKRINDYFVYGHLPKRD